MGVTRQPAWQTGVARLTKGEEKAGRTVKLPAEWRERERERERETKAFLWLQLQHQLQCKNVRAV
jgi:hypothetical protein